ncbi:MAG: penicillin-insensitive murein endopeptidase [Acidobacteriota bacterium]
MLVLGFITAPAVIGADSICYGTTSNGKLENGCKLPYSGSNFTAYSRLGSVAGRTYVHCKVSEIVLAAYNELKDSHPDKTFVYGETGWASGGSFKPHKTHQNGLSVDFMTPVLDKSGKSVPFPTNAFNKYGYDVDFDTQGSNDELTIDFEAAAAHILAIKRAADARKVKIWRVIFDPELQPFLHTTKAWKELQGQVEFSKRRSWVRHDDHYHIDFEIPCRPLP